MAAPTYTLATVTKNPDGTITLGNKPASAYATATQHMGGGKVPLPVANLGVAVAPGPTPTVVDLLDLTGAQMDEAMALSYTDCDADPADSPAWSYPGMFFDAIDPADGGNYHYYCTRGTYVPGNTTTGAGPAWHRIEKF